MKICGIIAEYNPFHKGHAYQLQYVREHFDCIVVILSGYFSQRGLPSLLSKKDKTELALKYGADLVLELPVCFASQSANQFARYAIESLSCIPIHSLCFGSETNDLYFLKQAIIQLNNQEKNPATSLQKNTPLKLGSNDILACQYIQYCEKYDIHPFPIQRIQTFKSATQTRYDFKNGKEQFLDSYFLKEQYWESYYPYLRTFLCMSSSQSLSRFFLVNEGIENRLKKCAAQYTEWKDFLEHSISKTYTRARIQRTCLMILLQITKQDMETLPSFFGLKVLGMNQKGKSLLKYAKYPVYTKYKDLPDVLKNIEIKSLQLYNSVLEHPIKESSVIYHDI